MLSSRYDTLQGSARFCLSHRVLISPDVPDRNNSQGTKSARCCTAALCRRKKTQPCRCHAGPGMGYRVVRTSGNKAAPLLRRSPCSSNHPSRPRCVCLAFATLHLQLGERPSAVELELTPRCSAFPILLQFDYGHVIIERQALQEPPAMRVCLYREIFCPDSSSRTVSSAWSSAVPVPLALRCRWGQRRKMCQ